LCLSWMQGLSLGGLNNLWGLLVNLHAKTWRQLWIDSVFFFALMMDTVTDGSECSGHLPAILSWDCLELGLSNTRNLVRDL
jgi:hypothetical protein